MKEPTFDAHGYPTDQTLEAVRTWPDDDVPGLVAFVCAAWRYPERAVLKGNKLYLSTVGWSGNEDIIEALRLTMFWRCFWQQSKRGGHYWFEWAESWNTRVYAP